MKYLKTLALAAIAGGALTALIGASSASASVLCSTTTTPCNSKWPAKVGFVYSLVQGTQEDVASTAGELLDSCTESVEEGTLVNPGSETETEEESMTSLTFGGCTLGTKLTQACPIKTDSIAKSDNGTVTFSGNGCDQTIEFPMIGSCDFGAPAGTDAGLLTATTATRTDAVRDLNAVLKKTVDSGAGCPNSVKWTAEFTMTKPTNTDLYVEPN